MFKNLYSVITKISIGAIVVSVTGNNFATAQQWQNVGSSENVSAGGSSYNNLLVDNVGNYYLSYYDVSVGKGSVQKFDGTNWSYVGGSAGITNSFATFNSLSINAAGNSLYYTNQGTGLEVRQFNGVSWTQLQSPVTSTINYQASAVSSSNVLFTYSIHNSGTVQRYVNGAWEQVGNTGFSNGAAFAEMVIGSNNKVYTCNLSGGVRVYENSTNAGTSDNWNLVGGNIVDAATSGEQYTSDIAIDANNNLYVAYVSNSANGTKLNVKKFDGTSWIQVGNPYFSTGKVQHVALAVTAAGDPYVVASRWENDDLLKNTAYKLDNTTNTWGTFGGDFISDGQAMYNDVVVDNVNNYLVLAYSQGTTRVKRIALPVPPQTCTNTDPGNNTGDLGCITFNYRGQSVTYTTVRGADGKIWLQQNLGSTKVATSLTDEDSYGDLFQWGRWDDGHQKRNSTLIAAPSANDPSGLAGGSASFYSAGYNSSSNWWKNGITSDKWEAENAAASTSTNGADPCRAIAANWRLPNVDEINAAMTAENITEFNSALSSNLKLVPAGMKDYNGIFSPGTRLYLWSSSSSSYTGNGQHLYISQFSTLTNSAGRDAGMSVRCIKDITMGLGTNDIKKTITVGVYPNPTNAILNIKTDTAIDTVNVTNVVGQRINTIKFSNNQINMQGLPNGMYIVELFLKNGQKISKKVIKN
ncbi:hypothetical protein ASG22_11655 [Chryseobacterium sp. Leaf405]|uniref:T9SS type A sorting domain-containing protein n=1 Tax=Chryseobacterium sp. Leaf405 TaxID=1736367 RepID=UPI0006F62D7E|nr:T9SS type A sorting domain-containing protein [Chryseobacterium sp. Leaf405]KQT24641.1 hypothetical protein ASG22_11655 [Chryseobacterium sp. Leaf405]